MSLKENISAVRMSPLEGWMDGRREGRQKIVERRVRKEGRGLWKEEGGGKEGKQIVEGKKEGIKIIEGPEMVLRWMGWRWV
jgi:hypothetical protein